MFVRPSPKSVWPAAAVAAAGLLLAPAAASAQAYTYQGAPRSHADGYGSPDYGYASSSDYQYPQQGEPSRYGSAPHYRPSYDRPTDGYGDYSCRSERRQRQGAGVAIGASFGAVLGSQFAARGRRTEGSVLGALVGAAIGGAVGGDSARSCDTGYGREHPYGQPYGYADRTYNDRDSAPEQGYGGQSHDDHADRAYSEDRGYGDQGRYDTGRNDDDDRYRSQSGDGYASDCRPVAVESRDVYGRTVTRYQQAC